MDLIDDVRDHREKIDKKNGTIAINICHLLLLLELNIRNKREIETQTNRDRNVRDNKK